MNKVLSTKRAYGMGQTASGSPIVTVPAATTTAVPKIIWSFWDGSPLPPVVEACVKSWRKYAPGWDIRVLDKASAIATLNTDVFKMRMVDHVQRAADVVRAMVIHEHGGLWLDASILLMAPLSKWVKPTHFTGFNITYRDRPVYENWAFAAPPRDPFVREWLNTFLTMNEYPSAEAWYDDQKTRFDLSQVESPTYLAMHCSGEIVKQRSPHVISNQKLYDAKKTALAWLFDANSDIRAGVQALENGTARSWFAHKFRGCDRDLAEKWVLQQTQD